MARKPAFIRNDEDREAEIQRRLLDRIEARFRRRFARVVVSVSAELLRGYVDLGFVPPASDQAQAMFRDVYRELALASARAFGRRVVTQGKQSGLMLETKKEGWFTQLFQALANAWVNQEAIRRRIVMVTETTRAQIVAEVEKGQAAGDSVDAIARNISKLLPQIGRGRGALIARTETHGAANYAMHETAKSTGLELVKVWKAGKDHRVRAITRGDKFDHLAMHGQIRDMDDPFDMPWLGSDDEPLKVMYPGEAGLPGGAVINCRCVVAHRVKR